MSALRHTLCLFLSGVRSGVEAAETRLAERAEKILAADEVCGCLDETGGRQVRIFERCERCGALMESDLAEQLAEQSESADEWREQWERAKQRAELAERAAKDAQMKERALTDYFADASRRADQERERAERAERDRDELIRNGLTDLTETARQRDEARQRVTDATVQWDAWKESCKEGESRVAELEAVIENYLLWEPRKKGHAAAHERLRAAVASPDQKEGT